MNLPSQFDSAVFRLEDAPNPLPKSFAIITVWDPDGLPSQRGLNDEADRKLRAELQRRGVIHFKATGGSPPDHLAHHEDGWAAVISKEAAIELGRDFRQLGIWWIENDDLILIDCATGDEKEVAKFSERIMGK